MSESKKELEFGKRYSWDEIADVYPDMWAFVTDITYLDEDVDSIDQCVLLSVCRFEDKHAEYQKVKQKCQKFRVIRTTFRGPVLGVVSVYADI